MESLMILGIFAFGCFLFGACLFWKSFRDMMNYYDARLKEIDKRITDLRTIFLDEIRHK